MHGNRSPTGRGGGRASAALPLLDDVTTSPASRRLASARPALAPKCQLILARTLRLGVFVSSMKFRGICHSPKGAHGWRPYRISESIVSLSSDATNLRPALCRGGTCAPPSL